MKPFDYINNINSSGKTNLMRGSENDTLAEAGYNPWLTNTALSYFPDTVLIANEINQYSDLPKRAQYEYLLNMVRPGKRWSKWAKESANDDLDSVCAYYQVNRRVGKEYLTLLTTDQITTIKTRLEKGGNK